MDRVDLVLPGRGGTGEVVDPPHWPRDRRQIGDIGAQKAKARMRHERRDILQPPGNQAVEAQDPMALRQKSLAQMRADEPGAAGHDA